MIFAVRHFAGCVAYVADGFLEKNMDTMQVGVCVCLRVF
jgi:myosin heavy subunit